MKTIKHEAHSILIIILNGATNKEDSPIHGLLTAQDFQACLSTNEDYTSTPIYHEDSEDTYSLHG